MAKGEGPLTPEVIHPGNGPAERSRAYRINKAIREKQEVPEDDLAWLTEYKKQRAKSASRTRKVSYSEETAEAVGTGDAAYAAALAAPQLAKEEGRRIDALIREATNATASMAKMATGAFELMMKMSTAILDRNGTLERANISMLDTFRKTHIDMTHAHAALITQQAEVDADNVVREAEESAKQDSGMGEEIIQQFLPVIMAEMQKRAAGGK